MSRKIKARAMIYPTRFEGGERAAVRDISYPKSKTSQDRIQRNEENIHFPEKETHESQGISFHPTNEQHFSGNIVRNDLSADDWHGCDENESKSMKKNGTKGFAKGKTGKAKKKPGMYATGQRTNGPTLLPMKMRGYIFKCASTRTHLYI